MRASSTALWVANSARKVGSYRMGDSEAVCSSDREDRGRRDSEREDASLCFSFFPRKTSGRSYHSIVSPPQSCFRDTAANVLESLGMRFHIRSPVGLWVSGVSQQGAHWDPVSPSPGAWIITGGSHTGVMKRVGEAVRDFSLSSSCKEGEVITIGIATWGTIHNREALIHRMVSSRSRVNLGRRRKAEGRGRGVQGARWVPA